MLTKSPHHKKKRLRPIDLWKRREAWKAEGKCVDCGGEVAMKLDNTPSVRCKDHLRGNTGKRSRFSDGERAANKADEELGGHLDSISFVDYYETMFLVIKSATPAPERAPSPIDGASYRMIHDELGPLARRDWTIDGLRVLKTAGRIREGSSILITRYLALDIIGDATDSDANGDATSRERALLTEAESDEYDALLAFAQQPSSYAEVAYA